MDPVVQQETPITKRGFRKLLHRWEKPLIWLSGTVTLLAMVFGLATSLLDEAQLTSIFGDFSADVTESSYFFYILLAPIILFLLRYYQMAGAKSNAIRVGPRQFPKLWEVYSKMGIKIQIDPLPKLYVTNGNGVVNAFALSCNTRHKYIVLHSEIAMLVDNHPDILEFVLAHELAHHKLGHTSLWRIVISIIPGFLPPLGASTIRAQEYSADRVAMKLCDKHQGAMNLLAAGPWIQQEVNSEAWLEQCDEEHREFFVRIANIMSDHAVLTKRYKALNDIENIGFSKHGNMF